MPPRRDKSASREEDSALWRQVAGSITPLAGKAMPVPEKPAHRESSGAESGGIENAGAESGRARKDSGGNMQPAPPPSPPPPSPKPANLDSGVFGGISASDAKKLKSGAVPIKRKIDLHGLTLMEAEAALIRFMHNAGGGVVLVITGKGRDGGGVIRQNLPRWLAAPPLARLVIAFCRARPQHGGDGAFYVKLRKKP